MPRTLPRTLPNSIPVYMLRKSPSALHVNKGVLLYLKSYSSLLGCDSVKETSTNFCGPEESSWGATSYESFSATRKSRCTVKVVKLWRYPIECTRFVFRIYILMTLTEYCSVLYGKKESIS
jgi:hypothetical protein